MKRKIASIILILLSVWFMLPIFKGVLHIGMIYPVLIFLFLAAVLAFWDRVNVFFKKHKISSPFYIFHRLHYYYLLICFKYVR